MRNWVVRHRDEYTRARMLWAGRSDENYVACDCECGSKLCRVSFDADRDYDGSWRDCSTYDCVLCGEDANETHEFPQTEEAMWAALAGTMFRKS